MAEMKKVFAFGMLFIALYLLPKKSCGQEFQLSIQSGHSERIKLLKFSNNSELLASAGDDKKCIIWDLKSRKQLRTLITQSVPRFIFFLKGDSTLVTADTDRITLWDVVNGKKIAEHSIYSGKDNFDQITNCFEDNGRNVIYTTEFGHYVGLNSLNCDKIFSYRLPIGFSAMAYGDSIFIYHNTFNCGYSHTTPNEKTGITTKIISKTENKKITNRLSSFDKLVNPHKKLVYFVSQETIRAKEITDSLQFNIFKNTFVIDSPSPVEMVSCAEASHSYLIVGFYYGDIRIHSPDNGKIIRYIKHHDSKINSITISHNEKYFATCSTEDIILWDAKSIKPIHCFRNSSSNITTFSLSSNQKKISIAKSNGQLKHWNLETNEITLAQLDIPIKFSSVFIKNMSEVNDSLTELSILFGLKKGEFFTHATEYRGKWFIYKNQIDIEPIKQYNYFKSDIKIKDEFCSVKNRSENIFIRTANNTIHVYSTENGKDTILLYTKENAHQDRISCLRIDEINNLLYSSSEDGALKIWNLSDGLELATLLSFGKDFLYLSPENYYYSSKGSIQNVNFRKGLSLYPFEQFDIKYNRPEKVMSQLPFIKEQELLLFETAFKKRMKWLGIKEENLEKSSEDAPTIKITSEIIRSTETKYYPLKFIATDSSDDIKSVTVLINGCNYTTLNYDKNIISDSVLIELSHGKNLIQIFATNSSGIHSYREGFYIEQTTQYKPNLYVLSIGSGKFNQMAFDLKYAEKDAKDIANFCKKNRMFNKVFTTTITNEEVKKTTVMNAIENLKTISIHDHVIVFFAGHGVLDNKLNYYLSTSDIDFDSPSVNGISYEEIINQIEKIPSRSKVFFIDACHSGELDKDDLVKTETKPIGEGKLVFRSSNVAVTHKENAVGLKNSLEFSKLIFADLRENNGVAVISSAGGSEYAIEGEKWNNGIFTYCLINGMKKKNSDVNHDGKIYLSELQEYLTREVKHISNGLQMPTSRSENIYNDFLMK